MQEIELKSKELKEFIYLELNKNRQEPICDEDLENITEIQLNSLDLIGEPTDETILDLIFFKNLKVCTLMNMNITNRDLDILKNLPKLEFLQLYNCNFSNNKKMEINLIDLVINNCPNVKVSMFEDIQTLQTLRIVNCNDVDTTGISKLKNLSKLFLQNLNLTNIDEIEDLKNLEYLNLNGSIIENLDKIQKIKNLIIEHNPINVLYDEEY